MKNHVAKSYSETFVNDKVAHDYLNDQSVKEIMVYSHLARQVIAQAINDIDSPDSEELDDANQWLFNDNEDTDCSFKRYCDAINIAIAALGYDELLFEITPDAIRKKILESSESRKNIIKILKAHKTNEGYIGFDLADTHYKYDVRCEQSISLN